MPFKSKTKRKTYKRRWSKKNKDKQRKYSKNYREKLKNWYKNLKNVSCCVICNDNRSFLIEFHHKYPRNKLFGIHEGVQKGFSIKKLEEEVKKCAPLCANHHRIVHHDALTDKEYRKWKEYLDLNGKY